MAGQHRKISVIAGLFYLCVLPLYLPFEEEYWSPKRVGSWIIGIEDVLLLFVLGSGQWAMVGAIMQNRLTTNLSWPIFLRRYAWLAFLGMGTFLSLWFAGLSAISASIIAQALISILVLILRPDLWPLAALGCALWMPLYMVNLKVSYLLWPGFETIWNHQNAWGHTLFGLPTGEILWVASGAAGYPVAIGYIVNARLHSLATRDSSASTTK